MSSIGFGHFPLRLKVQIDIFNCAAPALSRSLALSLSHYTLLTLSLPFSLRSQPALSAIVLFICVILIYSPYYSFALLRQCDGSTDVSLCVCVCAPANVYVCTMGTLRHSLFISMFLGFSLIYLPYARFALLFFCYYVFLIFVHTHIHMSLSLCLCVCVCLSATATSRQQQRQRSRESLS